MGKKLNDTFVSRWGDAELDDKQYVTIPGWILRHYHKFVDRDGLPAGLTSDEFQTTAHIMSFKYDTLNAEARPSLVTVSDQTGKHISSVRRTVKRLETKGAMTVDRSKQGSPNTYDFSELVRQCRKHEVLRLAEISINATPSVDATPTPSVDASTPLAYTLPEDQNKLEDKVKDSAEKPAAPPKPKRKAKPKTLDNIKPIQAVVAYRAFGIKREETITRSTMIRINMVVKELRERWQNGNAVTSDELKAAFLWHVAGRGEDKSLEASRDAVKVAAMVAEYRAIYGEQNKPKPPPADKDCTICGGTGLTVKEGRDEWHKVTEPCACRKEAING